MRGLKSAGLAMVMLGVGLSPLMLAGLVPSVAQTATLAESARQHAPNRKAEVDRAGSSTVNPLLQAAKQHFRRAEFKQAIATYQQIMAQPGVAAPVRVEALFQPGDPSQATFGTNFDEV